MEMLTDFGFLVFAPNGGPCLNADDDGCIDG